MAQHDYVIANGTGAAVRSDLNNALAAIVSNNSGATEPATMYAYQWWADTSTGLLKLRNAANNAWITLRELDGTLTIEAGTVSAPGLAFASDLNTGIYSPSADQLAIATNGVERVEWGTSDVVFNDGGANYDFRIEGDTVDSLFFVDASTDRVGLGTSSPSTRLHVSQTGSSQAGLIETDQSASVINFKSTGQSSGQPQVGCAGSDMILNTNGAERVRIDSSGRVGIGTAVVNSLFEARGTSDGQNIVHLSNNAGASDGAVANKIRFTCNGNTNWANASYDAYGHFWNVSGSEAMRIDGSKRLLVGTSTARDKFNNASGETPNVQIEGTGTTASGLYMLSMTANNTSSSAAAGPAMFFGRSEGTTTGSYTVVSADKNLGRISFQGADGTEFVEAAKIDCFVDGTPGANDMPGRLVFSTTADGASSPTERMRIGNAGKTNLFDSSGGGLRVSSAGAAGSTDNIFTGFYSATSTTSEGTASIAIRTNGDVRNANNSYGSLSDAKLKENIVNASSQWDDLKALQVRNFNFKEGQTHRQIGLIAQEVELVSPGLVNETPDRDEDGNETGEVTKGVNYSVLYMKAVKALQEAMERIETLEAKVAALEAA